MWVECCDFDLNFDNDCDSDYYGEYDCDGEGCCVNWRCYCVE